MHINDNNFLTIQGWMRTELDLKGNDLMVYAIIYGFSQAEGTRFTGGLQYLADWCGATKNGIQKNIKNLLERGLINKYEVDRNGVKFCEYATKLDSIQLSCTGYTTQLYGGIQLSCTNNIDNNIKENIEKSNYTSYNYYKNGKNSEFVLNTKAKEFKPNLYHKCIAVIDTFTNNSDIRSMLIKYLNYRLEVTERPLYINMWKGMLVRLEKEFSKNEYLDVIQYSLEKGYLTFYAPPNRNSAKTRLSEPNNGKSSESWTEEDAKRQEKFLEKLKAEGKRTAF